MSHIKRALRRTRLTGALALAVVACIPATALGYDAVFFEGTLAAGYGFVTNERHLLTEVSARSLDGRTVCVAAANDDGSQAGEVVGSASLAVKPYCGCIPRRGYVRATVNNGVETRARQNW